VKVGNEAFDRLWVPQDDADLQVVAQGSVGEVGAADEGRGAVGSDDLRVEGGARPAAGVPVAGGPAPEGRVSAQESEGVGRAAGAAQRAAVGYRVLQDQVGAAAPSGPPSGPSRSATTNRCSSSRIIRSSGTGSTPSVLMSLTVACHGEAAGRLPG
jgi:hypothetical protein